MKTEATKEIIRFMDDRASYADLPTYSELVEALQKLQEHGICYAATLQDATLVARDLTAARALLSRIPA